MDKKKINMDRMETPLPYSSNGRSNLTEQFYERHGLYYYSNRNNRSKMIVVGKLILNILGVTAFILGIAANLNNWFSTFLIILGAVYTIGKIINEWDSAWPKVLAWVKKIRKKP